MTHSIRRSISAFAIVIALTAACGRRSSGVSHSTAEENPQATNASKDTDKGAEKSSDADKDTKPDVIDLPPATQRRLGITVTAIAERPLAVTLEMPATVQPNEGRMAHVRPLARGRVQAVHVKVGDHVEQGRALADFDNIEAGEIASQYDAARAELSRLQAQLATATSQAERSRKLTEIGAAPQKEYEANLGQQKQVEASIQAQESTVAGLETRLKRYGLPEGNASRAATVIRAPLSGVVTVVSAAPGDVVDSSSDLFAIADISRVYVQAQVFEKDLGEVRVGQLGTIKVDPYPDESFSGRLVSIGDVIDPQTRTAAARFDVANPKGQLKLGMFTTVEVPIGTGRAALAVPTDAVQSYEGKSVVFVRTSPSQFAVRPVETGRAAAGLTEITRGLHAGDAVVTQGAFQVKSAALAKELGDDDKDKKE